MNWNDPEQRLALIERVGSDEYSRLHREEMQRQTIRTVNGYPLRYVSTRFGRLVAVDGTGRAFRKLDEAVAFAEKEEPRQ